MQDVDLILKHATVAPMDASYTVIEDGAIAIQGDTIVAVGSTADIEASYQARESIDYRGRVIIPGLVNTHTHVPMTLLRGLADDLRLDVWLLGYMLPVEREFVTPEFVELGTKLACAEMILSGVTTFNDMYYFEKHIAAATADVGLRAVCGQTILKFPSPDADSYEQSLAYCREFIEEWNGHPLIQPAVAPHAPYTATATMLGACRDLAIEFDVPLHIHISETGFEVQTMLDEQGMPVVSYINEQALFDAKVIAAHCVHVNEHEIGLLGRGGAGVAHNPSSNLKLASGIAPITQMLREGVQVGIGTDGTASNNDLDMFEETRLAALLAKTASNEPTSVPARTALEMATSMGARTLHAGHLTGSLEPGKRADLIVLDINQVHSWPSFNWAGNNLYSRIVYTSKSSDVQDVMCNGQWLMRDRKLLTVQVEELLEQAAEIARDIDRFLIAQEADPLRRLVALGETHREESFEVQVKATLESDTVLSRLLEHEQTHVLKTSHYIQHDTYFEFSQDERIRHREDDYIDEAGSITDVRTRLTLMSENKEREFADGILLSRSRFIAPARQPLRFYREYFKANSESAVVKERRRWQIEFRGIRLYINFDELKEPATSGYFLEIKSRTWSLSDAEIKAQAISDILSLLDIKPDSLVLNEYIAIAANINQSRD